MVDATVALDRSDPALATGTQRIMPETQVARTFSVSGGSDLSSYGGLCRTAVVAPAQCADWVTHWMAEIHPDTVIAELGMEGMPVFALALEVERLGPFSIARFMGGRHANGNFAPTNRSWTSSAGRNDFEALFRIIGKARPDIDLIMLERLAPELDGIPNPLLSLPHCASPNLALAVDLTGGFERVLGPSRINRRRKKHRAQIRKFEAAGSYRRFEATSIAETSTLLEAFFAMKAQRFSKMGIANVFADVRVRKFFRALFLGALAAQPRRFVLHGLEVAGKLRAVTGSSIARNRLVCEFGAIEDDELSQSSPGDFLFFENICEACERGYAVYDFSVGDEPYKRQWCNLEIRQFDVLVPLTVRGRLLAHGLEQRSRLKTMLKNNPTIWRLAKLLRRKARSLIAVDGDR